MYIYIYNIFIYTSLKQAHNISTFPFINLKNMPRVLPILSRPSNLLRRRKNIHWSPLSRRDATFPVPRRVTNSTVFNPKCATGPLAYCFSVDYLAPRSPPFPGDAPPILSATEGGGRGLGGR